jgi:hypothetical protein
MTHEREKLDPAVVAIKPTNQAERSAAEPRAGAKGNAVQHSTHRGQYRTACPTCWSAHGKFRRYSPEVGAVCGKAAVRGALRNGRPDRDRRNSSSQ